MEDETGRIRVGVHFGSPGFGHKTASGFLALAQGLEFGTQAQDGEMGSPPVLFEIDSELGQAYISAMQLAGDDACAGRDIEVEGPCPDHPDAGVMKRWVDEQVKPGLVDWPAVQGRLIEQGIVLVGGGADEAPQAYKRLPEVLAAHAGSVRVKHTLRPLGVAMAGRDVHDPYKD